MSYRAWVVCVMEYRMETAASFHASGCVHGLCQMQLAQVPEQGATYIWDFGSPILDLDNWRVTDLPMSATSYREIRTLGTTFVSQPCAVRSVSLGGREVTDYLALNGLALPTTPENARSDGGGGSAVSRSRGSLVTCPWSSLCTRCAAAV